MPASSKPTCCMPHAPNAQLQVKILTPEAILWEGTAEAVSSKNAEGAFDILPEHANFITLIIATPIRVVLSAAASQDYTFDKAVIFAHENTVSIFADVVLAATSKKNDPKDVQKGLTS